MHTGPRGLVRLIGELDIAGVPTLRAALATVPGPITFDCSELTFIDAYGLHSLVEARDQCAARGVPCGLLHPSRCLTMLLEILEIADLFADEIASPHSERADGRG